MGLGQLILVLILAAIGLGLLNKFGPTYLSMDGMILRIINIVVIVAIVVWLLFAFGLFDSLNTIHVGRR